ncbi:MAG: hypothetical protein J6O54_00555 [Prevotella sp.]|nr:hypothetical protein [Prevotella sp.]
MEREAKLWGEKLDDQSLAIHGKRVAQVFKDFDFRTTEALVRTQGTGQYLNANRQIRENPE